MQPEVPEMQGHPEQGNLGQMRLWMPTSRLWMTMTKMKTKTTNKVSRTVPER